MNTYLTRIDLTQNMKRFYCLSIQPDLLGGVSLIREWGRIGRSGQLRVEHFESKQQAGTAFYAIATQKQKKGYQ